MKEVEEIEESNNLNLSAFYSVGLVKGKIQIKDNEISKAFAKKPEKTEKLEKPVAKPEEKPAGKEGKQRYLIQLAALSDPAKADALKQKLAGLGVHASVSRAETSKGEIHRVRVGPFASQEEAKAVMNKLGAAGVSGIMVPQ